MTGAQRPTIFKYIDSLKSEESLSRKKILDCEAGRDPPKQRPKHTLRDNAIKTSVLMYQKVSKDFFNRFEGFRKSKYFPQLICDFNIGYRRSRA